MVTSGVVARMLEQDPRRPIPVMAAACPAHIIQWDPLINRRSLVGRPNRLIVIRKLTIHSRCFSCLTNLAPRAQNGALIRNPMTTRPGSFSSMWNNIFPNRRAATFPKDFRIPIRLKHHPPLFLFSAGSGYWDCFSRNADCIRHRLGCFTNQLIVRQELSEWMVRGSPAGEPAAVGEDRRGWTRRGQGRRGGLRQLSFGVVVNNQEEVVDF